MYLKSADKVSDADSEVWQLRAAATEDCRGELETCVQQLPSYQPDLLSAFFGSAFSFSSGCALISHAHSYFFFSLS
jgi:hypothetical protein